STTNLRLYIQQLIDKSSLSFYSTDGCSIGRQRDGRWAALILKSVSRPVCHPAVAGSDTGLEASSPRGARCHGLMQAARSLSGTNLHLAHWRTGPSYSAKAP